MTGLSGEPGIVACRAEDTFGLSATAAAPAERGEWMAAARRPLRILVVEDDPLVLMGTVAMIEDLGHDVVEARSGTQALALVECEAVDAVLTDVTMPGMTGVELAQELSRRRPHLPVVLVTGHADVGGNGNDLPRLAKPFTMEDLAAALHRLPIPLT